MHACSYMHKRPEGVGGGGGEGNQLLSKKDNVLSGQEGCTSSPTHIVWKLNSHL